jgi:hypothetical protein
MLFLPNKTLPTGHGTSHVVLEEFHKMEPLNMFDEGEWMVAVPSNETLFESHIHQLVREGKKIMLRSMAAEEP